MKRERSSGVVLKGSKEGESWEEFFMRRIPLPTFPELPFLFPTLIPHTHWSQISSSLSLTKDIVYYLTKKWRLSSMNSLSVAMSTTSPAPTQNLFFAHYKLCLGICPTPSTWLQLCATKHPPAYQSWMVTFPPDGSIWASWRPHRLYMI